MKKTNFPSSMIAVAAVVAFGMVGSQLDLGGLSGQAAGGESAGCGGDAYYDEDLGALVDSEGNIIDESGEASGTTAEGGSFDSTYQAHVSGPAMEGQSRVSFVTPLHDAAQDLADMSNGEQVFIPRISITQDGAYGIIGFAAPGYEDMTQIHLLEYNNGWQTILAISADRGQEIKIMQPEIQAVLNDEDSTVIVFNFGQDISYAFNVDTQVTDIITPDDTEFQLRVNASLGFADATNEELRVEMVERMADIAILDQVQNRVAHPWLDGFVAANFGDDVTARMVTSMNNRYFVALSTGDVLAIEGCEVGNSLFLADDELTCATCNEIGGCDNVLNKYDMLEIDRAERLDLAVEVEAELIANNRLQPLVGVRDIRIEHGQKGQPTSAKRAVREVYESCTSAGSGTGSVCYRVYGCTIAIRGSSNLTDWVNNARSVFGNDQSAWGDSANTVIAREQSTINRCGSNLKIIGHSRGGAIASWMASRLGVKATTYAAPRSSDGDESCHGGTRYYFDTDPVSAVGSSKHISHNVVRLSNVKHCTGSGWSRSCNTKTRRNGSWGGQCNNNSKESSLWYLGNLVSAYRAHVCSYTDKSDKVQCWWFNDGMDY